MLGPSRLLLWLALAENDQALATFLKGLELYQAAQLDKAAMQFQNSMQMSPAFAPSRLYLGAALAEGVGSSTGLRVDVKWPNDLYVGDRKLAGTLIETRWRGTARAASGSTPCPTTSRSSATS